MVLFLIALLVVLGDQLSKSWIRANLLRGQSLFDLGFLRIIHVHNTGAAFGIFPDYSSVLAFIALLGGVAILLCVFVFHRRFPFIDSMLSKSAFGLIFGGTIGNLIDRVRFGSVTDFVDFRIWPVFNVADSAVTIGVIIFAYSLLRSTQASRR